MRVPEAQGRVASRVTWEPDCPCLMGFETDTDPLRIRPVLAFARTRVIIFVGHWTRDGAEAVRQLDMAHHWCESGALE